MNRKASIGIVLVFALALLGALGAGAQGKGLSGGKLGLVFSVPDILLQIEEASFDGLSAGLGLKYWLAEKMALRGVLEFNYNNDSGTGLTTTAFGLSGAFEYHLLKAKVSPYVGGLAGIRVTTATGAASDFGFLADHLPALTVSDRAGSGCTDSGQGQPDPIGRGCGQPAD
jgi:hypothetical protein